MTKCTKTCKKYCVLGSLLTLYTNNWTRRHICHFFCEPPKQPSLRLLHHLLIALWLYANRGRWYLSCSSSSPVLNKSFCCMLWFYSVRKCNERSASFLVYCSRFLWRTFYVLHLTLHARRQLFKATIAKRNSPPNPFHTPTKLTLACLDSFLEVILFARD